MARARRRNRTEPSLFPFLSILACVIGALALLITSQAVGQIAAPAVDVDRYEGLEARIERDRQALAGLRTLAEEVAALEAEISEARAEQQRLEAELGPDISTGAPLRARLEEIGSRNSALERELELLAEGARERASELEAREARPEAAVRVRPSGSGKGLSPYFVECRRQGLRLHTQTHTIDVPAHRISTSAEFRRFVRSVAQRDKATVIFLIRPGGVAAREVALRSIREARLRTAEIPVPGDGPLDLSAFEDFRSDAS